MKPWQAWTVTICAILVTLVEVMNYIEVRLAFRAAGKQLEELTKDFDADLAETLEKAREKEKSEPWLPKPKSRVIVNPPQR